MTTIASDSLPWLAKPSTGYDLFSKPPERPVAYPQLSSDDEPNVGPKRNIANRGTEIFVGKGNEVRCADLQDLKARQTTSAQEGYRQYKTLDLPDLDFEIHQLEISKDGLFLAIVGEKELAVCVLPAEGLSRMENPKLRVPAFHAVGKNYHNADGSKIVRAVWHPLGVEGASLVVLTNNGMIRTYDFTIGQDFTFDIPDQTLDLFTLSGQRRHVGGFYADQEEMEPASCCFGEGNQGWRPLTLYILMRGGDIYALTPLVPSRWKASREYLQNLSLDITADLESLDEKATVQEKLTIRQQTKWINDVLNQEVNFAAPFGNGSPMKKAQTCLGRPEVVGPSPQLQGPFLFQPVPPEFSGEEYFACDIFHIEAGAIGVIGVLFSSGKVDICLEFDMLRAKWVDKKKKIRLDNGKEEEKVDLPIIAAYESIDLGFGDTSVNNWPVFVADPRSEQVWYVNHNSGVVSFSMKPWLGNLATVMDDDEEDGFMAKSLEKSAQSIVQGVIDHGKRPTGLIKPIIGSVVVYEAYLGYILVAATPNSVESVEFDEVLARATHDDGNVFGAKAQSFNQATPQRNSALQSTTYTSTPPTIKTKTSILSPPYTPSAEFTKPSALPVLLRQAMAQNSRAVRAPIVFSTESNEFLRQARDTLKVEYDRIMEAAQEMYDRAALQRIEYRKQLETIHKASENLEKLRSKDVRERLGQYITKQEELQARADEVLKVLIVKGEMGLSDAEKTWFKEVEKIEERVSGQGRAAVAVRKEQVAKMLEMLAPMVQEEEGKRKGLVTEKDGVPEEVRMGKLKQLRELLDREDSLVKATKKKLENLSIEVELV